MKQHIASADFAKMQEIFLAAVERHRPEEWDAYLAQACTDDGELRRQVNLLLKASPRSRQCAGRRVAAMGMSPERTKLWPNAPARSSARTSCWSKSAKAAWERSGWREQEVPVKRVVAVKLIKAGMDSKQVLARFEAERQALALMDHPNIAKVLDVGATDGRPYFVMELVKGVPITKYCDEHHLTPRQRLELFVPVCQAIQHAHQKGIIHRDIKPSNVLVALYDDKPVPKVIDFGVAKATGQQAHGRDASHRVRSGSRNGRVHESRTSQSESTRRRYSQRHLFTRRAALRTVDRHDATGRTVCREVGHVGSVTSHSRGRCADAEQSTCHDSGIAGDCRQARPGIPQTDKAGAWRVELDCHEGAGEGPQPALRDGQRIGDGSARYLADEAVQACPPSAWYRLRKFVHRNKGPALASAALAVSLLACVAAVVAMQAKADRDRATREAWTSASVAAEIREARERVDDAWGVTDYADRMQRATDAAVGALHRADDFAAGGSPTDATRAELASTRQAVDELARHTRLVVADDENRQLLADDSSRSDFSARVNLYRRHHEALRQFGLDPIDGQVDDVAQTIANSRIRDVLLGMLLGWQSAIVGMANIKSCAPTSPRYSGRCRDARGSS